MLLIQQEVRENHLIRLEKNSVLQLTTGLRITVHGEIDMSLTRIHGNRNFRTNRGYRGPIYPRR